MNRFLKSVLEWDESQLHQLTANEWVGREEALSLVGKVGTKSYPQAWGMIWAELGLTQHKMEATECSSKRYSLSF